MTSYALIFLSIFSLTCQGTNTSFHWTDISHSTAASSTHGEIGDYVAAGLGINTHETSSTLTATRNSEEYVTPGRDISTDETSSTLAITVSENQTYTSDSTSRSQTQSDKTATFITTSPIDGASRHADITANITDATSSTDCWQSWVDYWSASSLNHVTYETSSYAPITETKTELRYEMTLIPSSSWQSEFWSYTYSKLSTIYSDGYPVSVSVSYDPTTVSDVGWTVVTLYSTLSEFHTTFTETYNFYDFITTTRSTTELPTPSCNIPTGAPECSMQWSSYIYRDNWNYYNDYDDPASPYFPGTPDCTQAIITGDWCTSMASFYFARETMYGQNDDVGWVKTGSTSYFPASKSLAPGCSLGCQACSITGESVQLLYWPPSTASLVENGTQTATLTPFAENSPSLRTVSFDGTILTSPTMYISYDILHAANSCGAVGKTYRNTILPLLDSNHLFSLEPIILYHGYGHGYRTSSFDLADLNEPVPDTVYERQSRCLTSHISWLVHDTDQPFSCARTEPYAPIIGVPPEVRALDPEWESCNAWYGGLFDPPKALQPADAIALPTMPSTATPTTAALPQSTIDSGLPAETSKPATTSLRLHTSGNQNVADPTRASPTSNLDESANHGSEDTILSSEDGVPQPVVTKPDTSTHPIPSKVVAAIVSVFLTQGVEASQAAKDPPKVTPDSGSESHVHHGVVISAGSGAHTVISSKGHFILDGTPLMNGQATVISGQTISALSGTAFVNGVSQHHSVLEQPRMSHGIFTVEGQEHTAVKQADGAIEVDGEHHAFGDVTAVDGATITVASEGVIFDATIIPYAESSDDSSIINIASEGVIIDEGNAAHHTESPAENKQSAVFTVNGHTYSVGSRSGSLKINGVPASVGNKITTNGDILTIGSDAINLGSTTIPFVDGQTVKPSTPAAAEFIVAGDEMEAFRDGANVFIAGTKLTLGQVATISGTRISVADNGIVIGTGTATFSELEGSTANTDNVVTVDGTVYSASTIPGQPDAVLIADHTLSEGGPAATVHGQVVTKGSDGISIVDPTASATATFHHSDSFTANADGAVTIDGTVYSVSSLAGQSDAVLIAGHTLSEGGPAATIHSHVMTKGSNGVSIVDPTVSATATLATEYAKSVVTMDGTVYTGTPIPGRSDEIIFEGQTLSIGGSGANFADYLATKDSNRSSIATSSSVTSDKTSEQASSSIDVSGTSNAQESPSAPSEESEESEESLASKLNYGSAVIMLSAAILLLPFIEF